MDEKNKSPDWRMFLSKHKAVFAIFIIAAIILLAASVYVFYWFSGEAQDTDLVPSIIGEWSTEDLVWFMLWLVFWELVIIGIPAAILALLGWLWWKRLPQEERETYDLFKGDSNSKGGGGLSFLLFVGFVIKVYLDGNWDDAISTWNFDYVVDSIITVLIWGAIIAVPVMAIIFIAWLVKPEAFES